MLISIKCGSCGFPNISSENNVACEIDFLESRILYICPKCKFNNVMQIRNDKTDKEDSKKSSLPSLGMMRY